MSYRDQINSLNAQESLLTFIIFLDGLDGQCFIINISECVDQMSAQEWINVFGNKMAWLVSVLAPVCDIADFLIAENIYIISITNQLTN